MTDSSTAPPPAPSTTKPRLRLTALSHGAGCACKLGSVDLSQVLRHLPTVVDPRVLVDAATRDDAALFRLSYDRALVATADEMPPLEKYLRGSGKWREVARGKIAVLFERVK